MNSFLCTEDLILNRRNKLRSREPPASSTLQALGEPQLGARLPPLWNCSFHPEWREVLRGPGILVPPLICLLLVTFGMYNWLSREQSGGICWWSWAQRAAATRGSKQAHVPTRTPGGRSHGEPQQPSLLIVPLSVCLSGLFTRCVPWAELVFCDDKALALGACYQEKVSWRQK